MHVRRLLGLTVVLGAVLASVASAPPPAVDAGPFYPVAIQSARLTLNSIGEPVVTLELTNDGDATLTRVEVTAEMFDSVGPVEQYGYDDTALNLVEEEDLGPGAVQTGSWTLHGFEGTTRVELSVGSIIFAGDAEEHFCRASQQDCGEQVVCLASETVCE